MGYRSPLGTGYVPLQVEECVPPSQHANPVMRSSHSLTDAGIRLLAACRGAVCDLLILPSCGYGPWTGPPREMTLGVWEILPSVSPSRGE